MCELQIARADNGNLSPGGSENVNDIQGLHSEWGMMAQSSAVNLSFQSLSLLRILLTISTKLYVNSCYLLRCIRKLKCSC